MVATPDKSEDRDGLPPTYTAAPSSTVPSQDELSQLPPPITPSSASSSSRPLSLPTNLLTIDRTDRTIKDAWTIDLSLPKLPGSTPSVGPGGIPYNAFIKSTHGSVDVAFEILSSGDVKGPAHLAVESKHSSVTVTVYDERHHRFRLLAASTHGSITIRIPSTYAGTVSSYLQHGKLTFSSAVRARLTTVSEQSNEGRFLIGDWAVVGYEDDGTSLGDHLSIQAHHGRVMIDFVDDRDEIPRSRGFLRKLLW